MFNVASYLRSFFGAILLTTGLLVASGIYCATRMPSGIYPEITFPRISIVAKKSGLDLQSMELQVTQPMEQAVRTVIGASQVRSRTIRGGCDLSVDFAPGTDMRRAEQLAWNKIGAARSQMPADVEFTVEQMTPSVFPILSVVLTGGDSPAMLRDYAFYQLAPQMKNIADVQYCNVAGGDVREIVVEARPDDLLAAGMSAADLADQIAKLHRLQPVGRIEESPFAYGILVNTQCESARQIEDLVISTKGRQPLSVRDVANVVVLHQDRTSAVGYEGKDAVVLTVFRRLGGSAVNISHDIRDLLKNKPPPRNIKATVAYDQSRFIDTAVENVRDAILIGSLFSVLILLAFLRSWRATLISALAIPITLAITFLFLYLTGETFNLMSLGGLAVAIGLIIDDTVVVIENIARHLTPHGHGGASGQADAGVPLPDPIDAASGEITSAVIGSTLTTVLVFVPLAFIVGVYGQFFASLSWSLSIAVLVSMVISLTLIPVCAAKFLAGKPMPEPGRLFHFVSGIYEWMLGWALRMPWVTLAFSVAIMGLGVLLYTGIPAFWIAAEVGKPPPAPFIKGLETGLMPAMDEGAFVLDYFAPAGTPLKGTQEIAQVLEQILMENPDIDSYVRRSGTELGMAATQTNRGDIQVILRPADDDFISLLTKPMRPKLNDPKSDFKKELERDGKEAIRKKYRRRPLVDVKDEIEDEVKDHFGEHQLKFELLQLMQDELNDMSGASRPIEIKLFGPDYVKLRELAEQVGEMFEKKPKGRGLKEINTNVTAGNPDLMIKVNKYQAGKVNLTAEEIERQLRAIYFGQVATQVRESSQRITDVRVRYPNKMRFGQGNFDPDLVRNQWILLPEFAAPIDAGAQGAFHRLSGPARAIALASVATIQPVRTPEEQVRENQQPVQIVTTELNETEAGLGSVVADVRQWMGEMEAAGAFPAGYHWELGGHFIRQQEAFRSLAQVMGVAIVLVYIMLTFQFRSAVLPLLIFLTQPLSLVSGMFALWITGTPLNISSFMGFVLLIGLDMKNGILLVEYIQQLRAQGMPLRPALLEAGRTRFRPILMTSLAAILGLFPLALGIGPGSQMQQPLAIMVIGGLTANMLFTRMVIPVGYLVLERRTLDARAL
jgi:multidrug efflux pump subunit AcrB